MIDFFFPSILKSAVLMLYLKTIYSKTYNQWFQFITISFCLFLNPLLPLEVSLKLQLILKGNCLIKICIWRLFWMQRYSIQTICTKTQSRQMVFAFPVVRYCVTQQNRRNYPASPSRALVVQYSVSHFCLCSKNIWRIW